MSKCGGLSQRMQDNEICKLFILTGRTDTWVILVLP